MPSPADANDEVMNDAPLDRASDGFTGEDAASDTVADNRGDQLFSTVLDRFDRADGALDSAGVTAWIADGSAGLEQYAVANGELTGTPATSMPIWWNDYYGGSAVATEVFVTVRHLSTEATDLSLLLVSQTFSPCDFLQVRYDPAAGTVSAASCQLGTSTAYGAPVSVGDISNHRLGARFEMPGGRLSAYVDTVMIGSWVIDQWRYIGRPGRIGIWLRRSGAWNETDRFDDFGGG